MTGRRRGVRRGNGEAAAANIDFGPLAGWIGFNLRMAQEAAQKPAEARQSLPPAVLSPGVLTINAKTARQLGIDLADDVQSKAKQVYR